MDKTLWRKNWLISINELTDYHLQKISWLNENTQNPHWTFVEFMCSYFNDLSLENGYEEYLKISWLTEMEYLTIKDWHNKLNKYESPNENDWAVEQILNDEKWIEIVNLGKNAKENLLYELNENEKKILEKNLLPKIQ